MKLAVIAFMEKDANKVSHWIDVPEGAAIDALIVTIDGDKRLYVVTEGTPLAFAWVHDRWPRMVSRESPVQQRWPGWDDYEPGSNDSE